MLLLLACTSPSDTGKVDSPAVVEPPCAAITGSASIAVVSRADPSLIVSTTPPADGWEAPVGFAGPDKTGRYYLTELTGVVKRSDDGGCSWTEVGTLATAEGADTSDSGGNPWSWYTLSSSPYVDGVYAYEAGRVYSSPDGATWTQRTVPELYPATPIAVDPGNPLRLRAYAVDGIATSVDGGATWTTVPTPEIDGWFNIAIDATDIDRVALGRDDLYVATDGATWVERNPDMFGILAWDAGDLVSLRHGGQSDVLYHVRRSTDLGVTFTELPIDTDPYASVDTFAADGGLVASAGYRYESGVSLAGLVQLTTTAGTTPHLVADYEGAVGIGMGEDRVVVAFAGPYVSVPD